MRVVLATAGTDGGVFPRLGLGATLHTRGRHVTLAAPETYRGCALGLGLEFRPLVTAGRSAGCSPTRTCGTRSAAGS